MPHPPPPLAAAAGPLADAAATAAKNPWANDLFPAVLLLALGAALVAVGAWIAKPRRARSRPRRRPPRLARRDPAGVGAATTIDSRGPRSSTPAPRPIRSAARCDCRSAGRRFIPPSPDT